MPHEPFDDGFFALLARLNAIIAATGEPLEGNICYEHHNGDFLQSPLTKRFAPKRSNLLAACHERNKVLEIGINGGHSALIMLYHNPALYYVGVDICEHRYTRVAMDFLQEQFPGRVECFVGDSLKILPEIYRARLDLRFDVVHIDGLHTLEHCKADTFNSITLCNPSAWIIVDDTDMGHIKEFYDGLITAETLLDKKPDGWTAHYAHDVGMMPQETI